MLSKQGTGRTEIVFKQDNWKGFKESPIYIGINQFREMSKDFGVSSSREPSTPQIWRDKNREYLLQEFSSQEPPERSCDFQQRNPHHLQTPAWERMEQGKYISWLNFQKPEPGAHTYNSLPPGTEQDGMEGASRGHPAWRFTKLQASPLIISYLMSILLQGKCHMGRKYYLEHCPAGTRLSHPHWVSHSHYLSLGYNWNNGTVWKMISLLYSTGNKRGAYTFKTQIQMSIHASTLFHYLKGWAMLKKIHPRILAQKKKKKTRLDLIKAFPNAAEFPQLDYMNTVNSIWEIIQA